MLPLLLDAAYLAFLLLAAPWILYRRLVLKKRLAGLASKLTGNLSRQHPHRPCLWFHAVSVGEVLQLQSLLSRMQAAFPHYEFVITTTTATGFDVARTKYPNCTIHFFPLDFSWAIRKAFRNLKPKLVVLVELELWPNFLVIARQRDIPVAIINGRISDKSFRIYRRFAWLLRPFLNSCSLIAAQSPLNAERFLDLGAPPARVFVTGNIKFDGVETNRENPKTLELRRQFGIAADELVFLAGSTQAPEEEFALKAWETLHPDFPNLRLLLVPRHPERFNEVASLVLARGHRLQRRSLVPNLSPPDSHSSPPAIRSANDPESSSSHLSLREPHPVLLLDTLGELSKAWGLADLAFVGGSLTNRGGQNMIEPAAFGAAVLFGPNTWNFRDTTEALLSRHAALVVHDPVELTDTLRRLLTNEEERRRLGTSARQFALSQQGATSRTIDLLTRILGTPPLVRAAADKAA